MIKLNRSKDNKWILQKNISSTELMQAYVNAMREQNNEINTQNIQDNLRYNGHYIGRSIGGSRCFKSFNKEKRCFLKFAHLLSLPTHSKALYANAFQALVKALALLR
ncbi:hypothetical protein VN0381_07880 [Helicobacter pylori]